MKFLFKLDVKISAYVTAMVLILIAGLSIMMMSGLAAKRQNERLREKSFQKFYERLNERQVIADLRLNVLNSTNESFINPKIISNQTEGIISSHYFSSAKSFKIINGTISLELFPTTNVSVTNVPRGNFLFLTRISYQKTNGSDEVWRTNHLVFKKVFTNFSSPPDYQVVFFNSR